MWSQILVRGRESGPKVGVKSKVLVLDKEFDLSLESRIESQVRVMSRVLGWVFGVKYSELGPRSLVAISIGIRILG